MQSLTDIENIYNTNNDIMIVNNNQSENILFIGSCRIYVYLNYFIHDDFFGKKYNYLCILVHTNKMIELSKTCIHNNRFKDLLSNSTILVSEYIKNYNYFNSSKKNEYNLFQMNTNFKHTIFLPNYCNPRIYVKDIIHYGDDTIKNIYKKYISNEEISFDTLSIALQQFQHNEINRYCNTIKKSVIPELEQFVRDNIYIKRIAHTINHTSNILSIEIYKLILNKYFERDIPDNVLNLNKTYEFLNSQGYNTKLTYYDKMCLNINIDENIYNKEESDNYLL